MAATPLKATTTAPALLHSMQSSTPKEELSTRNYSDDIVIGNMYDNHRGDGTIKINLLNCISAIENIFINADKITETVHRRGEVGSINSFEPGVIIVPPLCILHRISSMLSCKAPGIHKAHETTLEILEILSNYPWEAKAALTLLAFATDYGDLWLLYLYSQSDPLAKSLAIIKRVATLKKHLDALPYRQVLLNPKSLIRSCLLAIKYMNEILEFSKHNIKELSDLPSALRQIPFVTYWVIHTIVASRIELSSYLSETENQPRMYLNELSEKMAFILSGFERNLDAIRNQYGEVHLYHWLIDHIELNHTDISLVFPRLLSGKPETEPLFDGSTQREVSVRESLSGKNVILLISGLDISTDTIEALNHVYERLKTEQEANAIVWIPIIPKSYDDKYHKKYDDLRSTMKWYSIQFTSTISGMRYIEEKWLFGEDPLVVVLNSHSKVVFSNAIHLIRVWGINAVPFTYYNTKVLLRTNWPELTLAKFSHEPRLQNWFDRKRSILFYGGKDSKWIQQFEEKVAILRRDPLIIDEGSFETVRIEKDRENGRTFMDDFWITQWSYFIVNNQIKGNKNTTTEDNLRLNTTTEDNLRLIFYENEDGWVVLTVGSTPVVVGRGSLILRLLEKFPEWNQTMLVKGFPHAFKQNFNELAAKSHQCDEVTIPDFSGWIPLTIICPECRRSMERNTEFDCNHKSI